MSNPNHSKSFSESGDSNYSIKQFHNKEIILPNNLKHHPKVENLLWHQQNIYIQ